MTLTEVAEMLRLRTKTVAQYARRGELAGRQIGRRWVFQRAALDRRHDRSSEVTPISPSLYRSKTRC